MSTNWINEQCSLDNRTMAFINMYAVFGSIEELCRIDEKARSMLTNKKPIKVGFEVGGGPCASLLFENGTCVFSEGTDGADILMKFDSPERFNDMINGGKAPIPSKGLTKAGFMLKDFINITNRLSELLRATPEALADAQFKAKSTELMCYVIAGAISQCGNHDFIGKFSAGEMSDGEVAFEVAGGPAITISCSGHKLKTVKKKSESPRCCMTFASMEIARNIFDNVENSMACVCEGKIIMTGLISMIDNVNRILDRVSLYLN